MTSRALVVLALLSVPHVAGAEARDLGRAEALDLYDQSRAAYKSGQFSRAAALLERAYALHPTPVLLYNLARAHESAGDDERAVASYRRYLDGETEIEDRAAIERRIRTLEERLAERKRAEAERQAALQRAERAERAERDASSRPPAPPPSPTFLPWVVVGLGASSIGTASVFGLMAQRKERDAESAATHSAAMEAFDQGERFALYANVGFVAGAALLVGGGVWLGLRGSSDGAGLRAASIAVTPRQVSLRTEF